MWHNTLGSTFSMRIMERTTTFWSPPLNFPGSPPPFWGGLPTILKPLFWESAPKHCVWKPIFSAGRRRRWNNRRHSEVHLKKSMETGRGVDRLSKLFHVMHLTGFCNNGGSHLSPHAGGPLSIWGHLCGNKGQTGGVKVRKEVLAQNGNRVGLQDDVTLPQPPTKKGRTKQCTVNTYCSEGGWGGAVETQQFQRYPCSVLPSKLESQRSAVNWNKTTVCCVHFMWNDAL